MRWWMVALALGACAGSDGGPTGEPDVPSLPDVERADVPPMTDIGVAPDLGPPGEDGGPDLPDVPAPTLPPFDYPTGCRLPVVPPVNQGIAFVEAFPNLGPSGVYLPLFLTHAGDGSGRVFVVQKQGRIRVFQNTQEPQDATTFLDVALMDPALWSAGEGGLLGLAFHPDYAVNGQLFVNYTRTEPSGVPAVPDIYTIVARLQVDPDDPNRADPATAEILLRIKQPFANHNGGMLAFGPDGYLYIAMGDGGSGGDPQGHGQDTSTLHGSILRIDVDGADGEQLYGIPPDNPFATSAGPERPEIYAWGLRNPWRMSFDRLTGALWVGDVGQNAFEEINIVEKGGNYGWNTMEASACYPPGTAACDQTGLTLPVAEYPHTVGRSVTGGYVYRGTSAPSLYGAYLYADFETFAFFAYRHGEEPPPTEPLGLAPGGVSSFGEDEEGEVYAMTLFGHLIYRMVEVEPTPFPSDFPTTLSATGCFADLATLTPAAGVLPYEVNSPLWSDGADKDRFVSLPEGARLGYRADGAWEVPPETVFVKHFSLNDVRLETRFLVVGEGGEVAGYTYRWNDEGTEAHLLTGAETRDVQAGDEALTWRFPSRQQCLACHRSAAGGGLGWETAQLNRQHSYQGFETNQLDALAAWDLLADAPADFSGAPALAGLTSDASAEDRARGYLHANCANCHRPEGGTGTEIDLRYTTALDATQTVCQPPLKGDQGVPGSRLLSPGDPGQSVLYRRVTSTGPGRMPPISSSRVDDAAAAALWEWIGGLDGPCGP